MDEGLLILLGLLLVVGVPALAISAFVMVLGARGRIAALSRSSGATPGEVAALAARLDAIGERLAAVEARLGIEAPSETVATPSSETAEQRRRRAAAELDALARAKSATPLPGIETTRPAPEAARSGQGPAEMQAETQPGADAASGADEIVVDGTTATESAPAPRPATPPRGLEETLGTRWAVWVGGVALALGAIFLVKFTIEQGYFGPAARLTLAGLFSAALVGAGEWLRRREIRFDLAGVPSAHIPGVLTAAGTVGAFATVYGAHALYGFIGPATAFLALGAIGVAAMVAAILHGPWLAVLGALGAYATPVLVASTTPNTPALVTYLLVVTATSFAIARVRLWLWVALSALALSLFWGFVIGAMALADHVHALPFCMYVGGLGVLVAVFLVIGIDDIVFEPADRPIDWPGVGAFAIVSVLTLMALDADGHGVASRLLLALVVLGPMLIGLRIPAVAPAAVVAATTAALAVLGWSVDVAGSLVNDTFAIGADGLVAVRPRVIADFLTVALVSGVAIGAIGFAGARRATPQADRSAGWFAAAGVVGPTLILVAAWLRASGFERDIAFAGLALALAALSAYATATLVRRESPDAPSRAVAAYAVGTLAALGAALAIGLDRGVLTVALALVVPAIARVWLLRPIPVLRPLAALMALIVLARVLWDPRIVGDTLGTTPIFNWILYGYGIPVIGFGYAAWTFRSTRADLWRGIIEAVTLVFAGLLALFEIRHLVHGGLDSAYVVFSPKGGLDEAGLVATMGFLLSAGAQIAGRRLDSAVYTAGASVFTVIGAFSALIDACLIENPMLTGRSIGDGTIFNMLLAGYALPALAAALAAHLARPVRSPLFVGFLGVTSLVLAFAYVTLTVRRAFHGPVLSAGGFDDQELWAYSAAWLAFGVALLMAGLRADAKWLRVASAAIVALTVVKVFWIDLGSLTGIWRALSFIGLGAVLVGIGLLYQKLLTRKAPTG
ncbi:DUF2339 domain-containing protein [Methyloraptor flagellatus]|uniref:DUF2339 domain-containing protein n=1 Tax=Methyloraptor flagellatus TaxID=3162530 RepID=A0AAU7X4R2_9HYPH